MSTNTNTNLTDDVAATLAAIATMTPAQLTRQGASLLTEQQRLTKRTLETTVSIQRLLGALADRFVRSHPDYDVNTKVITETTLSKLLGDDVATWAGWSLPTVKTGLIAFRAHTAKRFQTWQRLVSRVETTKRANGTTVTIGDVTVHSSRVAMFKPHAAAYINWANLAAAGVARDDGSFVETDATVKARNKAAATERDKVKTAKNADTVNKARVALVAAGSDDVVAGTITYAALRALPADDLAALADVIAATLAALAAGTYSAPAAADDAPTGATETPRKRAPRKLAAAA